MIKPEHKSKSGQGKNRARRYARPPYWTVATHPDGDLVPVLPGNYYNFALKGLAPTAADARLLLIRLRRHLNWSRSMMACFVGTHRESIRAWENGTRNPSAASRRLLWFLDQFIRNPDGLKDAFQLMHWQRGEELIELGRNLLGKGLADIGAVPAECPPSAR